MLTILSYNFSIYFIKCTKFPWNACIWQNILICQYSWIFGKFHENYLNGLYLLEDLVCLCDPKYRTVNFHLTVEKSTWSLGWQFFRFYEIFIRNLSIEGQNSYHWTMNSNVIHFCSSLYNCCFQSEFFQKFSEMIWTNTIFKTTK